MLYVSSASAFCRLRTCDPDTTQCQTDLRGCVTDGQPLVYDPPCLSFAVASGTVQSLGLTDQEFLDVVAEAFGRWSSVDCGGGLRPGFSFQTAGLVDADGRFFCDESPELNMSLWGLSGDWGYEANSLGYTTSTFNESTGQVFDADVELHLARIQQSARTPAARRAVLLSIVTHEAGHFLGLAHSDDPNAVMAATYTRRDLRERPLTQDDIDGICAVFPPSGMPAACSVPGVSAAAFEPAACELSAAPPDGSCSVSAGIGAAGAGGSGSGSPRYKVSRWASIGAGVLCVVPLWRRRRRGKRSGARS